MSDKTLTQKDITNFISNTLLLGGQYVITNDFRIRNADTPEEDITFTDEVTGRTFIWHTYSTEISEPNSIICFPFVESKSTTSKDMQYYYTSLSSVTIVWLFRILITTFKMAAGVEGYEPNTTFLELVGKCKDRVDKKSIKELNDLFNTSLSDFGSIYYNKNKGSASLILGIDDANSPMFKSAIKLRAKTKDVLIDLAHALFDVPDDKSIRELYTHTLEAGNVRFPKFESFLSVYIKVWEKMAKYVEFAGEEFEDTSRLVEEIKKGFELAPVMKTKAQWLQQTPIGSMKPASEQQKSTSTHVKMNDGSYKSSNNVSMNSGGNTDPNVYRPQSQGYTRNDDGDPNRYGYGNGNYTRGREYPRQESGDPNRYVGSPPSGYPRDYETRGHYSRGRRDGRYDHYERNNYDRGYGRSDGSIRY